MEEGKKVIIDFTEKEESNLSGKGDLESIKMNGVLTVKNPSSNHKIWNSSLLLEGINSVSLTESEIKTGEIPANNDKSFDYELSETEVVQKPQIELEEIIDTYYERGEDINWNFVLNHRMPTSFTIRLKNKTSANAKCNVIKWIPEYFDAPHIENPSTGITEYKENVRELHWNEITVVAGDTASLTFRTGATAAKTDLHEQGKIEVDYEIEKVIRSDLNGEILALSDNLYAIDNEEVSQNTWECTVEFQNLSDFQVKLKNAKVTQIKETIKELVLDDSPETELGPNASWTKNFRVESGGIPKFSKGNVFTVLFEVHKKLLGHISKKSGVIPVAAIKCTKELKPESVSAHAKSTIQVVSITENIGTASLFNIQIEDTIPTSFKPPSLDLIKTRLRGEELRQGVVLEMDPNDENPSIEHKIKVSIPNLSNLTNPLNPNENITIEYPITAWDPTPGEYPCPLNSSFNVVPAGPPVRAAVPEIKVFAKTVRRKYRAYKSVTPAGEGEFVIPIVFSNKGEVPVEKVTIKDLIPPKFTLVSSEPEEIKPVTNDTEGGTQITWNLTNISPGEQIQIKYTIKGTGEYESQDPEISFE